MNAWWQMWAGLFSGDTCNWVIEECLKLTPRQGHIGFGSEGARTDKKFRLSTVRWVPRKPPMTTMWDRMEELFREANFNAFGFDLSCLREVQFTEYKAHPDGEQGHYKWHEDLNWTAKGPHARKLSIVIQLSKPDDYEGGDLQLKHEPPDPVVLRTRGTAIVFPSFHLHQVTPVSRGTRYSLVAWHEGPNFR
jgi:PKHD-type hydroxylase